MKNNYCVFTIVAKNYIGLGEILGKSLIRHNPDIDFFIIVADELDDKVELPRNTLIGREILSYSDSEWIDMAFKYNLTEFCTAIKPAVFSYLFTQQYEIVVYFDPDIYIYSSIGKILSLLHTKEMVITPHINGVHTNYNGDQPEWNLNVNGIFNLGFCAVRNTSSTQMIMNWWTERLKDQCFCERTLGEFTDQKWIDWIPAFMDSEKIQILRDLGMNLAPWNFFERKIQKDSDGSLNVIFREEDRQEKRKDPLVFVHYSGFRYNKLKEGICEHKSLSLNHYPDLEVILSEYGKAIKADAKTFDKFIQQTYSYNRYANNSIINSFHRRLYHGLPEAQRFQINPFSTGEYSFFHQLKKAGLISKDEVNSYGKESVPDIDRKKRYLNFFFKVLFRLLGFKRYTQFIKGLRFYSLPELHTFLIESDKLQNND